MTAESSMGLLVRAMRLEAKNVVSFELVHPQGQPLPPITPGAHIDVYLPGGMVRSYSLAGDPADRDRWVLGVLREDNGKGGSRAMHERVRVGSTLRVSQPRNAFALAAQAQHTVLIGGGNRYHAPKSHGARA